MLVNIKAISLRRSSFVGYFFYEPNSKKYGLIQPDECSFFLLIFVRGKSLTENEGSLQSIFFTLFIFARTFKAFLDDISCELRKIANISPFVFGYILTQSSTIFNRTQSSTTLNWTQSSTILKCYLLTLSALLS